MNRNCHTCRNQELCFIRKGADRLIYSGMGILYDKGKKPEMEKYRSDITMTQLAELPGDTEGIYKAIAEACLKYESEENND